MKILQESLELIKKAVVHEQKVFWYIILEMGQIRISFLRQFLKYNSLESIDGIIEVHIINIDSQFQ